MRLLSITTVALILAATVGCESAAPPPIAEQFETSPAAPQPAAPAEPAPEVNPAEKNLGKAEVEGQAAIARAAAMVAAARAAKAKEGEAPPDGAPPGDAPPAEPAAPDAPAAEAPPADDPPAEGDELSKAEVGVGVKGKNYGGPGFVTTPIETMFTVEERIAFEVQIPNTMKIYKAAHDNKGPKTHQEFMDVIIKENGVQLPELPQGSVYWYDAKTEQLLVRTPKPGE